MRYIYEFAGMNILIEAPFSIVIGHESQPFMRLLPDFEHAAELSNISYKMTMIPAKEKEELTSSDHGRWFELRYYETEGDSEKVFYYSSRDEGMANAVVTFSFKQEGPHLIRCIYDSEHIERVNLSRNICEFLQFETILKYHSGLWLHSSHIRWNGKGILFSGPSGIGKSTQANLWIEYEHAEILNGDKTALRKEDKWIGYGLPYAGSSDIFRNEKSEIAAIVCLGQGPRNSIRRMRPMEAFRFLYAQTSIHFWDSDFINRVSDSIMRVITDIPVYYLECLPDHGAVELLKMELNK